MISQFNTASPSRKASLTHAKRYVRHITSLFHHYTSFCCLLFGMLLFFSCGKSSSSDSIPTPTPVAKSTAKVVSSFVFEASENTALDSDVTATVTGTAIAATVPLGTDVTALTPTIVVSDKAIIAPNTGVETDFTSDVKYIVTAEDKSTQAYTVTVTVASSSSTDITSFIFKEAGNDALNTDVTAVVDATAKTITATVPLGTDVTKLIPTIMHTGASIAPLTGVAQDFTSDVKYIVTAEDKSTQAYTVTVTVASSSSTDITSFIFKEAGNDALNTDVTAVVDATAKTITATVPFGTDVTALVPTIIHNGVSIAPLTNVATDFTSPATYMVTAQDGTTQAYTVTVTVASSSSTDITSFVFKEAGNDALNTDVTAVVDATAKTITATVPLGTGVTKLIPTIMHTGASIAPNTGVATDFTSLATYTVTAADGTTQVYTVTVTVASSSSTDITSFIFKEVGNDALNTDVTAVVDATAKTITATVPFGMDVTALVPTIVHTGKSIDPLTGVAQDFTSPATYTVTAADGTTQVYTVTVTAKAYVGKYVTIPDPNFRKYLKEKFPSAFGTRETMDANHADITSFAETIDVSEKEIASLEGIQYFTKLTKLHCYKNQLTALDVTKNTALTTLYCYENQLKKLDVSKNIGLIDFWCNQNKLTALDVSKNTALTTLSCFTNQLTELDVRQHTDLTTLYCYDNPLGTLDVTKNIKLEELRCKNNQLKVLDVTQNINLDHLRCDKNELTELDVTKNTVLTYLSCEETKLTALDVTKNTALITLACNRAELTDLDVSKNLVLEVLYCWNNPLGTLDVSKNLALKELDCENNQLMSLDLSQNTKLTYLSCIYNILTTLDMTGMQSVDDSAAPEYPGLNFKVGEVKEYQGDMVTTNPLTTLKVNVALQDREEMKQVKTTRGTDVLISTHNTDGTVVCKNYDPNTGICSSIDKITSFIFKADGNNALTMDVTATILGTDITAIVPDGTDRVQLTPTILHTGKSVAPDTGASKDFTQPVSYSVTTQDGTMHKNYTVTVRYPSTEKAIKSFTFKASENKGLIENIEATINGATVPFGTDVTMLTPTIIYNGLSISPDNEEEQDFTTPVTYTVTAEDGSTREYKIAVTIAEALLTVKEISSFVFEADENTAVTTDTSATILGTDINIVVPIGTDVTQLKPTIVVSDKASVAPLTNIATDFTSPATYTVTAQDGTTQAYRVTVTEEAGMTTKAITSFVFTATANAALTTDVTATVDETAKTIAATVPFATDVTALVPTIIHNGVSIAPLTNVATDFTTSPATYTVTAQDGTSQAYAVTVTPALSPVKAITSFVFTATATAVLTTDVTATIDVTAKTIAATVPFATDVTALVPTIIHNGVSIVPLTNVATDFTSPATYTVTAADGTTQTYTVTVTEALSPANEITSFMLKATENTVLTMDVTATISGTDINIVVPVGTRLTALTPTIMVSDKAGVAPLTGVVQDFSNPVTYTVTAANGDKKTYTTHASNYATIPDPNFRKYLKEKFPASFGNRETMDINHADITSFAGTIKVSYKEIASLEGIQYFTKLTVLKCGDNDLTSLDVGQNTALTSLDCSFNDLTKLDVGQNTALTSLDCSFNDLTKLDVSKNIKLTSLDCGGDAYDKNYLKKLDVSQNTALTYLNCSFNKLTSLDVSKNIALASLDCFRNQLMVLVVSANTALTYLVCFDNALTSLDVTKNTALTYLNCEGNDLTSLNVSQNTALTNLECGSNDLTSLDVRPLTKLTKLVCGFGELTSLDVSKNIALTKLDCRYNQLTALDLTGMQSVEELFINAGQVISGVKNPLTTLKVNELIKREDEIKKTKTNRGANVVITTYNTDGTVVCGTDYNPNTNECANPNKIITSFVFEASKNQGISKDITATILGTDINIVVPTGTILTALIPTIVLTDKASVDPKTGVPKDFTKPVVYTTTTENGDKKTYTTHIANYVTIPDANFRKYLKEKFPAAFGNRETMDANHADITSFAGTINVGNKDISDLEGIQYFIKLRSLYCYINQLKSLDVSQNTDLRTLSCYSNDLTSLNVSKNIKLTSLDCSANQLMTLAVSQNIKLTSLDCSANQLMTLAVSQNIKLTSLDCSANQLMTLAVSQNIKLTSLDCSANQLMTLAVSKNIALASLVCGDNDLTSLDVSKNIKLTGLSCKNNALTSLNIIGMQRVANGLTILAGEVVNFEGNMVTTNPLTTLKVNELIKREDAIKDAKTNRGASVVISTHNTDGTVVCTDYDPNTNVCATSIAEISSFVFEADENTAVTTDISATILGTDINIVVTENIDITKLKPTIVVSDKASVTPDTGVVKDFTKPVIYTVTAARGNTKDYTVTIINPYVTIPDANFRKYLKEKFPAAFGNRETMDRTHTDIISFDEKINVGNKEIASLEGIQYFIKLRSLYCDVNQLTSLDVSQNTSLTELSCSNNDLTSLDVRQNTALTYLNCVANDLTSLNVSQNTALTNLECGSNDLTSLDVRPLTKLTKLFCGFGELTSLDVRPLTKLTSLRCDYNDLTSLDVRPLTKLTSLNCSFNNLKVLNVSQNTDLTTLSCSGNNLTSLDVRPLIKLTSLSCSSNDLTSLDVNKNIALTYLVCGNKDLTSLDVRPLTKLTFLNCVGSSLKSLDVSKNTALTSLFCEENQLTSLNMIGIQNVEYAINISAGKVVNFEGNTVTTNPLTTLKVNVALKDYQEMKDTKTNRGSAITITTYKTDGTVVCRTDYNPNTGKCR